MKNTSITVIMAAAILLVGCGKKATSSAVVTKTADTATVSKFLETDWSAHPLFPPGSALNLSEDQFKSLSAADEQAKSGEMRTQLASLKQAAAAVVQAGRDAAAKGDTVQARKCFMSLKQCGTALNSTNCLLLVQLVGQGFEKRADEELAKIGQ